MVHFFSAVYCQKVLCEMCRDYYWIQVEKHDLAERLREK